ncbi:ABC transporter substrate-binding protein [Rhodoplanes sp. TEM]|uniref:Thiamine pyrimidine synthase n=1 Tax=Rhodoplanes tepidamans TaxID=200616 RepID=A0ABT5JEJ4_RHOTP|nr:MULTISPECIES: ABC transporter substrate-binding protein [Rhodoplanes]MDC7787848.1 ABC transporter substrate-binding protein [Rhodoplanes tepidamans]MDC7985693.1 ABC transporter substrate-binding protein [Rhodoplanes sp. TEM]MDQ0357889.1 NitT/TauT family transport system substrate-binding protein [Rhodoplanes tepidamans]
MQNEQMWKSARATAMRDPTRRRVLGAAALLVTAAVAGGPAAAADKVTFVTDFGFNGRHAYYYVALDKGYYKDAGLDVEIVRGQGSADAVKQVAAKTAQLGFADAAAVILGRGNDQIPVKLVAMVYAKPPHAIYVLKESGIAKPKDLEGKRIADTAFSAMPKMFDAYAKAAKIDGSKVSWLVAASDALPGMLNLGRAEGIGQFTVGEALLKKAAGGKELVKLAYADVGLDYYSNGIIATDETIKSNPDLVKRFVAATLRGLKDAIADPAEAGRIMNKYHRQVDVDVATAETAAVAALAQVPGEALGAINPDRVQKTIDIIAGAYPLKSPVTVKDISVTDMVAK